ncbi:MAG: dual specificity protein phosphatase family protein [Bacteroidota bacterium]
MTSKIYWINTDNNERQLLGTMARPRGNDWLEDEIKGLKYRKVDILVSLLERGEIYDLDLQEEEIFCSQHGIEYINFPIEDVQVPKNEDKFTVLAALLADQIEHNKSVVIHCRMGIGRSSILAAAILIRLGYQGEETFEIISKHRGLAVPDTEEQRNWILSIEKELKLKN